ncbi:MAG: glycerol acyltransferase, partial [Bacteroidota bacterium]
EAVRKIEEIFEEGLPVLTFPAGLVSRKKKGVIRDPDWKKNFIAKAVQHKRNIIPVYVSGRCTNFFYRLANLRKMMGIKSNIEMLYLPDETYKHRDEHIKVIFGKPISWQMIDKSMNFSQWAAEIQRYVYALPESPEQEFKAVN